MPLYEYHCGECGARRELLQQRGAAAPERCEACGARGAMRRGVSQTSFHLKGSGWYVTDYKPSPKKSEEGAKSSPKEEGAGAEAKPETSSPETAPEAGASADLKSGDGA